MSEISEVVQTWSEYLKGAPDWEELVADAEPKVGGCGLIYELPNPIDRPNESFAVADMRALDMADPHSHANGEYEVYFCLQGLGKVAVGDTVHVLEPGAALVTEPGTVHITLPQENLVLVVVNTPPFDVNNYVPADPADPAVAAMIEKLRSA